MRNKTIIILLILKNFSFSQEEIGGGLHSEELINYLYNNYKTNSVLSYADARDTLYSRIDIINNYVFGIYTNYSVELQDNVDPSTYLYDHGMDCEHVWPQSMYDGTHPMKSDMHHLRPSKSNVNGSRGNKPFNEINDNETNTWFWLGYQQSNTPNDNIDEYSESGSSAFEPREDRKGDIARSMYYFYTIYTNEIDYYFFEDQKDVLYQWHILDPATENEIERTWAIAQYQSNIPNPFVLDNTLIERCYFYTEPEQGDINLDGLIDVVDIVLLVNYVLGLAELDEDSLALADLDNNDTINVVDVVLLINLILR